MTTVQKVTRTKTGTPFVRMMKTIRLFRVTIARILKRTDISKINEKPSLRQVLNSLENILELTLSISVAKNELLLHIS